MENRMNIELSLSIIVALSISTSLFAQQLPPDLLWHNTYGGPMGECCYSIQQTADGGYILAGDVQNSESPYSYWDFFMVKADENGDSLWSRQFGGDYDDECRAVVETSDGGYVVAGRTLSFDIGGGDFWLIKTDENGNRLWSRTYGGTSTDFCESVQQTADGGYILAGWTYSFGAGNADFMVLKTDEYGDSLWCSIWGGPNADVPKHVQQTSDGGYVVAGYTTSFGIGSENFRLLKMDQNGDSLWSRTYSGLYDDYCESALQTSDGGYVLAGRTESFGAGDYDCWIVKTDENGDSLWSRTFGGLDYDCCKSVIETSDSRYILAGWTSSFGAGSKDFWLIKVDSDGDSLWSQTYGSNSDERCYSVHQTSDRGFILGGRATPYGSNYCDFSLIKTNPDIIAITLDLIPHNCFTQIPGGGGSFQFDFELMNYNTSTPYTLDIWIVLTLPNGMPYPITSR